MSQPEHYRINVQTEQIDQSREYLAVLKHASGSGAVVSFCGLVREMNLGDSVNSLHLQHYSGLTESLIETICQQAHARWNLQTIRVVHRVGDLHPGDLIVYVATASEHRGDAFESCQFLMDQLKTQAAFWKRETTATGERWLEERNDDLSAADRWDK